ncbi:MAG: hypothetical protein A2857_03535 [Candidatus Levybacteria bacterium RIFCSPHIGHO2_01_FULL_36_15]|nr:MAG: hypothetical protein A2857_03535 [Candidatus Levybacteria bacterium RIFCSPHIGHO2_01_FULL_36_15]OGH37881.1 MAG: hypothetical protein A2905_02125 [Candidatus Levybacteria bacterium RIFCSPLOWO2_01_FULL_36_10]
MKKPGAVPIKKIAYSKEELKNISPTKTPIETPVKLVIKSINVDTNIELVGLDKQNRMDIPKDWYNVGWYQYGPKPGEAGNAAIDGHVDTPTGAPSVFYNLSKLKKDDQIEVYDKRGKKYVFVVTRNTSYPLEQFPSSEIFGPSTKAKLNLITCAGEWDKKFKQYSNRLVIYSQLVD